jgi:hypothetical protein
MRGLPPCAVCSCTVSSCGSAHDKGTVRTRCQNGLVGQPYGSWVGVANSKCARKPAARTGGSRAWDEDGSRLRSESISIFGTGERGFFEPLVKPLDRFPGSPDQWDRYLVESQATVRFFFGGCPEWKWKSGSGVCSPHHVKAFRPFEGRMEGTTWHVAIMDARSWQVHPAQFPGPLPPPVDAEGRGPLVVDRTESIPVNR